MDAKSREIVKSLAEMAWADGVLSPEERTLLLKILIEAGTNPEDADEIERLIAAPSADILSEPAQLSRADLDHDGKRNVMRALLIMSLMDGVLSFAEFGQLERVAVELDISAEELDSLRAEAMTAADALKNDEPRA